MNRKALVKQIFEKQSYLCIGLDADIDKIPSFLLSKPNPVFEFNKAIIDATKDICVAYKINTAFYESRGLEGWKNLQQTLDYIPDNIFTIADAKRGDIGNTSQQYAKAFFETLPFDALTVAPYMGRDSVEPFLQYKDKWTILLGLTSNIGSEDFQLQKSGEQYLYEKVLKKAKEWGSDDKLMFVIGATQTDQFAQVRKMVKDYFLLVPGVGAQGGSLKEISKAGLTSDCGLLVNASRAIIYASHDEDFAEAAKVTAKAYQQQMAKYLKDK